MWITIGAGDEVTQRPFGALAKVGWGSTSLSPHKRGLQALVAAAGELRTEQIVSTPLPPKPMVRSADGGLNLPHKTAIFKDVQDAERIDYTP